MEKESEKESLLTIVIATLLGLQVVLPDNLSSQNQRKLFVHHYVLYHGADDPPGLLQEYPTDIFQTLQRDRASIEAEAEFMP